MVILKLQYDLLLLMLIYQVSNFFIDIILKPKKIENALTIICQKPKKVFFAFPVTADS